MIYNILSKTFLCFIFILLISNITCDLISFHDKNLLTPKHPERFKRSNTLVAPDNSNVTKDKEPSVRKVSLPHIVITLISHNNYMFHLKINFFYF